jgi:ribosome-binding protein aMBF1 (putative translation factor)
MALFGHPGSDRQEVFSFDVPHGTPEEITALVVAYLRDARVKSGISQNQLSQLAGISRTGLRHIESGDVLPSFANVLRLARALKISMRELLRCIDSE